MKKRVISLILSAALVFALIPAAYADYTIHFDIQGHGTAVSDMQTNSDGVLVAPPADPTEAGWIFCGWFDSTLSTEYDLTKPFTADTTVYAKWVQIYTISFEMNGHGSQIAALHTDKDGKITPPADPAASGVAFAGWFNDIGLTSPVDFTSPFTADTTVYAKWVPSYTVSFDMNGHGSQIAALHTDKDGKITKPADPTATGYVFGGWFDSTLTTPIDFTSAFGADTTAYAKWTAKTTTINFDQQGGTGGTSSISAEYNSNLLPITVPAKGSEIFGGYYSEQYGAGTQYYGTDGNGTRKWDKEDTSVTLYANWGVTITLDSDSATTKGTESVVASVSSHPLPSIIVPTKTGFKFEGYFDSENNKYYNSDGTSAISAYDGKVTSLKAKWTPVDYTVYLQYYSSSNYKYTKESTEGKGMYYEVISGNSVIKSGYAATSGKTPVTLNCLQTLRVTFRPKTKYYAQVTYYQGDSRSSSDRIETYYGATGGDFELTFSNITSDKTIVGYFRYYTSRPKTADNFNPYICASVMLVSAAGIYIFTKKKKYE